MNHARCAHTPPGTMYPPTLDQQRHIITTYCTHCPVRVACITHAITHHETHGVWGTTEQDRRAILRKRGLITSRRPPAHDTTHLEALLDA